MLRRPVAIGSVLLAMMAAVAPAAAAPAVPAGPPSCDLSVLGLAPTNVTSPDGVDYVKWSGHVPSWDGIPLDVDVTLPATGSCALPFVVFAHGFTDDKTRWESETATNESDPNRSQWNNVWFASRGYGVLNYTARGWHDSCGPDSSADPAGSPLGLPPECTGGNPLAPTRQYWIHLDDLRYEVRDVQWLVGRLVDAGVVDPDRLGITGGSYGGGLTWLAAVANDRVMCGGQGWDPANGSDPCAGRGDGELVPWGSPAGVPLQVAAAVPEYTWADLVNVLLPNGRASDGAPGAPPLGDLREPIGVAIESYVLGLYAAVYTPPATRNGFFQPPTSTDRTADVPRWVSILQAGINTVSASAPGISAEVDNALIQLGDFKSPLSPLLPFDAEVPVLQLQGLTDPLFPPVHAELMRQKATAFSADYPLGVFYGDFGHPYASNLATVAEAFNERANRFFDHHLRGVGPPPPMDTEVAVTRCRPTDDPARPLDVHAGESLAAIAKGTVTFASDVPGRTTNIPSGVEGPATDPVLNGSVGPGVFGRRCPHIPETTDPGQATWEFPVTGPFTLVGAPVVELAVRSTAPDAELNTRLWDVSPDGMQTLVSRGTFRFAQPPSPTDTRVSFQLSANAWEMAAGHRLKLEVTGADFPYYQLNTVPGVTTVSSAGLHLPTLEAAPETGSSPAGGQPASGDQAAPIAPTAGRLPATGGGAGGPVVAALAVLGLVLAVRRQLRSSPPAGSS